jgi:putative transposase
MRVGITEAQQIATEWLWTYNHDRLITESGGITPAQKLKMAS